MNKKDIEEAARLLKRSGKFDPARTTNASPEETLRELKVAEQSERVFETAENCSACARERREKRSRRFVSRSSRRGDGILVATAWFVYMVRCHDGSFYTGATNDIAARVQAHNRGRGARYTRSRLPVALIWRRRVKDKSAALRLEYRVKALPRGDKQALADKRLRVTSRTGSFAFKTAQ